ncbi:MAG: hypothetical protein ACXU89_24390 [Xanthobacteraceae bacterium]
MPDRAAKFVSAIFASVLAGTSLAAISLNAVRAADDCLAAPNAETPAGGHWHYRIDRATKRHCWYLRTEGETLPQAAAPDSSAAAKPVAPIAAAPMQRSVADARAELPAQTSIEPPKRNGGPAPAMPANPAVSEASKATAPDANAPQSVVSSRWLDPSAMSSTLHPPPAPSQTAANVPPAPQTDLPQSDSPQSDSSQSDAAAAPPAAAAVVPLAAADSSQGLPASLPMLLAVMTGALALAGLTASLVLKFGGARRTARLRVPRDRLWEPVDDDDRIGLSPDLDADVVPRRPHFPRDLDEPAEPNDRVAQFYAQLSKQARN